MRTIRPYAGGLAAQGFMLKIFLNTPFEFGLQNFEISSHFSKFKFEGLQCKPYIHNVNIHI